MSEITALEKHTCAACGGPAEWNPDKQVLACSYCGTVSPYELDQDSGQIKEIDLVQTLREMPDEQRGWQQEKRSVRCQSCTAISVFDPSRVGQNCEFCGSPELVDYEEIKAPIRPQSVLPFKVSESKVREQIRSWYGSKWFAPGKLKRRAMLDTVKGLYVPYWTFDARVSCAWTADSGYYYYTTENIRGSDGRMRTQRVRKVRWQLSSGEIDHFFDDEPIPGSRGIDRDLLRGVEPFPTHELVPYDTAYLAGFVIEHYQVVLIEATRKARERMKGHLYQLCAGQVPGDTFRNLQLAPHYSDQTFKHLLVPVWLLMYIYGSKTYQIVVNGYTGKLEGRYPKSFWKIFFLILFLGLLLLALVWSQN